jgi:hypothetical protein
VAAPIPRFEFYEIVQVISGSGRNAKMNGQTGAVLGRALSDDGLRWSYAIHVDSTGISWSFNEDELLPTGRHAKKEDFYDGSSIQVIVDERGRGSIAPQE